jgi:hypothetical protein
MSSFGEIFSDIKDSVVEFGNNSYSEITNSKGIVSSVTNIAGDGVNKVGDIFNSGMDGIRLIFGVKQDSTSDEDPGNINEDIGGGD